MMDQTVEQPVVVRDAFLQGRRLDRGVARAPAHMRYRPRVLRARMARDAAHAGERMTLSVKLDHFSSSEVEGNDDEILEGARSEQRPVVSANANLSFLKTRPARLSCGWRD